VRALVTGAAGFLGSAVCRAAIAAGHDVLGLVRAGELMRPCPGVEYRELDWAGDAAAMTAAIDSFRAEGIVHCAGATPRLAADTVALYDANVRLVWTLLAAIAAADADPGAVVVSTAGVYGPTPPVPTPEDAPLDPVSHYAWSKVLAEDAVRAFACSGGVRACVARPFNLLGVGEPSGSVVSDVAAQLEAAVPATGVRLREIASVRDYVDVDDAARALLLLAGRGVAGEAYNIASGEGVSVGELVGAILDVWGSDAKVSVADPKASGTVSIGSPAKLRALGWQPASTLGDSLVRVRDARREG
jgi:nucleoside-diphosphate-sugar epimerase